MDSIITRMHFFYHSQYCLIDPFSRLYLVPCPNLESWQLPSPLRYTCKGHWIKYLLDAPMICFLPTILILRETELRSMDWWAPSSLAASWFSRLRRDERECVVKFILHLPAGYPWPAWVLDRRPAPSNIPLNMSLCLGFSRNKPLLDDRQPGSFKGSYCWHCQFFHSPLCIY